MGVVKDIADIIKDNPDAKKFLSEKYRELSKLFSNKWFGGRFDPNAEELDHQRILDLLDVISERDFGQRISDLMKYFSFILGICIAVEERKSRGVLISNFYMPGRFLYFPKTSQRKSIVTVRPNAEDTGKYIEFIAITTNTEKTYEYFVIPDSNKKGASFPKVRNLLDNVCRTRSKKMEIEAFREGLIGIGLDLERAYSLVHFDDDPPVYGFGLTSRREKLQNLISFEDPEGARTAITSDLKHVLNFSLV